MNNEINHSPFEYSKKISGDCELEYLITLEIQ